jgi:hypothetical protein
MLLHVLPRIYNEYADFKIALIDVTIPELNVKLRGGHELTVGRPYNNKNYLVAYRNGGRKALNGFVVSTEEKLTSFSVITRWAVNAHNVITHTAIHPILDSDFELVSQDAMLMHRFSQTHATNFLSRFPEGQLYNYSPLELTPAMRFLKSSCVKSVLPFVKDELNGDFVMKRTETLPLPTLEKERLGLHFFGDRLPKAEDAIIVNGREVA